MKDILTQATEAAQRGERLSRERDAYLYICAWDRCDLEAVCRISERAEHDPELREMLDGIDEEFAEEMVKEAGPVSEEEAERMYKKVQHFLKQYHEERTSHE